MSDQMTPITQLDEEAVPENLKRPYRVVRYYAGEGAYCVYGPAGRLWDERWVRDPQEAQERADKLNREHAEFIERSIEEAFNRERASTSRITSADIDAAADTIANEAAFGGDALHASRSLGRWRIEGITSGVNLDDYESLSAALITTNRKIQASKQGESSQTGH